MVTAGKIPDRLFRLGDALANQHVVKTVLGELGFLEWARVRQALLDCDGE
jgi:hypothetical protein